MASAKRTSGGETQTITQDDVAEVRVGAGGIVNPVDRTAWVDLPIGFDPYWTPEEGKQFVGKVCEIDARDPKFVRFRFIASEPTMCQKGDSEHAEDVLVEAGGFFTTSVYAGISKELIYHLQSGICPEVEVTAVRQDKVKTGEYAGKPFWVFSARVRPEDQRRLAVGREAYFRSLSAANQSPRPQLDEKKAS